MYLIKETFNQVVSKFNQRDKSITMVPHLSWRKKLVIDDESRQIVNCNHKKYTLN